MPENRLYLPESLQQSCVYTLSDLKTAKETSAVLAGIPQRCDTNHHLHLRLGGVDCILPRDEVVAPWISGSERDISVISRVGKQTSFTVKSISSTPKGAPLVQLSRRDAQEQAMEWFEEHLHPGSVLTCQVVRMESYGAFLDIGCGIVAMLPIERISTSRISHPKERFHTGQKILAVLWKFDREHRRITMTHRELLGTWMENASLFCAGETVRGIVRSIKPYGAFIELTPNLSGLTDLQEGLSPGDSVSVYIKSIRPESMKIKLQIVDRLGPSDIEPPHYQITDGILERWVYSPPGCEKATIETDFTASAP